MEQKYSKSMVLDIIIPSKLIKHNDGFMFMRNIEGDYSFKTYGEIQEYIAISYGIYDDYSLKSIMQSILLLCQDSSLNIMEYMKKKYQQDNWECPEILKYYKEIYPGIDFTGILTCLFKTKGIGLILKGPAGTGKSLLGNFIAKAFDQLYTPLILDQLDNKFNLASCLGKLFVYGDDLGQMRVKNTLGLLKTLITGGELFFERKGKDGIKAKSEASFIFNSNNDIAVLLPLHDPGIVRRFGLLNINKPLELVNYQETIEQWYNEVEYNKFLTMIYSNNLTAVECEQLYASLRVNLMESHPIYRWKLRTYDEYTASYNLPQSGLQRGGLMTSTEFKEWRDNYHGERERLKSLYETTNQVVKEVQEPTPFA